VVPAVRDRADRLRPALRRAADGPALTGRLAGQLVLDGDEIEDLAGRIDAQRAGRQLLARCARLPDLERAAIELVDIDGLKPREAAAAPKISPGALRVRLYQTTYTFSVAHPALLPGYTGFLAARQVAPGEVELSQGAMPDGKIPSCFSDQALHLVPPPPGSPAGTPYTTATGPNAG
jgi:hypothetical protein